MSRAWEAAVNAEFVAKVQKIVEEWHNDETTDFQAMQEIEYVVEMHG